jgi:hypothetical protein
MNFLTRKIEKNDYSLFISLSTDKIFTLLKNSAKLYPELSVLCYLKGNTESFGGYYKNYSFAITLWYIL